MKNQGKAATIVLMVLAAGCAFLALKVVAIVEDRNAELSDRTTELGKRTGELTVTTAQRDVLRQTLDAEKDRANQLERDLAAERATVAQYQTDLEDTQNVLEGSQKRVMELGNDLKETQKELAAIKNELENAVEKIGDLEEELAACIEKLPDENGPGNGPPKVKIEGVVISVTKPGFLTIDLEQEATGAKAGDTMYVHRGPDIMGKVKVGKIYNVTVALEVDDPAVIALIHKRDRVSMKRGDVLNVLSSIEGKIGTIHQRGFVSIDAAPEVVTNAQPLFKVFRGEEEIVDAKFTVKRIHHAAVVAELVEVDNGDWLRYLRVDDELKVPRYEEE